MSEVITPQPVQTTHPEPNPPYNPNWRLSSGKHACSKISMLPTDYLKEMIKESVGYQKTWFERALNERYLEFIAEAVKISATNAKDGIPPEIPELAVLFNQKHDQVDEDRFVDYIFNITRQIFAGKLRVTINEEIK